MIYVTELTFVLFVFIIKPTVSLIELSIQNFYVGSSSSAYQMNFIINSSHIIPKFLRHNCHNVSCFWGFIPLRFICVISLLLIIHFTWQVIIPGRRLSLSESRSKELLRQHDVGIQNFAVVHDVKDVDDVPKMLCKCYWISCDKSLVSFFVRFLLLQ